MKNTHISDNLCQDQWWRIEKMSHKDSELQLKSQDSQTFKGYTDVQSGSFKGTFAIKHMLEKNITSKVTEHAKNHILF